MLNVAQATITHFDTNILIDAILLAFRADYFDGLVALSGTALAGIGDERRASPKLGTSADVLYRATITHKARRDAICVDFATCPKTSRN